MPQNNILKIDTYQAKATDTFFFDNNVWMYVFCPLANFNGKRQAAYSKFLQYILSRNLHIYINSLVLAEFSNRYLKLDFDLCNKSENPQIYRSFKKDYVGSPQFEKTITDIKTFLIKIIKLCQRGSDEFNSIDIDDVFKLFEKIGFNDSYYLYLSKKKNWIVVTDDSDLTNKNIPQLGITILTI